MPDLALLTGAATLLLLSLALTRCQNTNPTTVTPADSPALPARGLYMGVLPIPASGQSLDSVYRQAHEYSEFVPVWGRPTSFYDFAKDLAGDWGKTFVTQLIRENGMFPLVQTSFMDTGMTLLTPPGMTGATMSDSAWRAAYEQAAIDIVRACRPKYLSLGNEVNRWYEKYGRTGTNGFDNYVSLYVETYDAVKEVCPDIVLYCVFAREIVDEDREADLTVLKLFPADKLDLLVFTSYPFAVQGLNRPDSIPDDYYTRVESLVPGKSFGFTELGWPSRPEFGGETGQADFLRAIRDRLTMTQGMNLRLMGWAWLHDLSANDYTGLIRTDGTEKEAYSVWKQMSAGHESTGHKSTSQQVTRDGSRSTECEVRSADY